MVLNIESNDLVSEYIMGKTVMSAAAVVYLVYFGTEISVASFYKK